jgi:predicted DsbA family dithiol-disulfide isomerase
MNSIIIIGTEPPCPRCKLLTKIVSDKVKEFGIDADVKHAVYTDSGAIEFAAQLGLEPGTASVVAKRMNVEIDNSRKKAPNFDSEFNTEYEDYFFTNWSYELDEHLRLYENKAKEMGILMTPSLIINGELKHSGSVPRLSQIEHWLQELKEA